VFLGLGVGFLVSALAGTGGKHGWTIGGFGGLCLAVAVAFATIAYSKRAQEKHDLSMLAGEMASARDANRVLKENTKLTTTTEKEAV
jgi:hypothetical protein